MKRDSNNYTGFVIYNQVENDLTEMPSVFIIHLSAMMGRVPETAFHRELLSGERKHSHFGEIHPGAVSLNGSKTDPVCRLQLNKCMNLHAEWKWYRGASPSGESRFMV